MSSVDDEMSNDEMAGEVSINPYKLSRKTHKMINLNLNISWQKTYDTGTPIYTQLSNSVARYSTAMLCEQLK